MDGREGMEDGTGDRRRPGTGWAGRTHTVPSPWRVHCLAGALSVCRCCCCCCCRWRAAGCRNRQGGPGKRPRGSGESETVASRVRTSDMGLESGPSAAIWADTHLAASPSVLDAPPPQACEVVARSPLPAVSQARPRRGPPRCVPHSRVPARAALPLGGPPVEVLPSIRIKPARLPLHVPLPPVSQRPNAGCVSRPRQQDGMAGSQSSQLTRVCRLRQDAMAAQHQAGQEVRSTLGHPFIIESSSTSPILLQATPLSLHLVPPLSSNSKFRDLRWTVMRDSFPTPPLPRTVVLGAGHPKISIT